MLPPSPSVPALAAMLKAGAAVFSGGWIAISGSPAATVCPMAGVSSMSLMQRFMVEGGYVSKPNKMINLRQC